MLTRRQLLGGGLAAGAALVVAGLVYEFSADAVRTGPRHRFLMLDAKDRLIVAAIAPVMLAGALPKDASLHADAIQQVVRGLDVAIAGLPLDVRAQIGRLFGILRFPPTRMIVAGIWHPWHEAKHSDVHGFLESWRYSGMTQLRSAYDALHQLVMASWYGNTTAWTAIGYPGPPNLD